VTAEGRVIGIWYFTAECAIIGAMPRSPLFGLVQRSLRVAQLARAREEPLDEVTDRVLAVSRTADTRATMSRRRFVAVSAAASAALALDACLPRRGSGTGLPAPRRDVEPVLIIGAGIAGLTAAYRLRQHGVPVRIIEAQQRVGGRMFSLRDAFADDQVCELGGELIDSNHASIRALAQELGIELDDLRQTDAGFDADVWWVGGARRTTGEVIRALAPVTAQLGVDRKAWPDDFDPTYHNLSGAQALDRMTIAEWLDRAGVSGWARELLDVAFTTEYGMPLDGQSALNMLTMIQVAATDLEMYGASDERFHVHLGNDLITRTLAERLGGAGILTNFTGGAHALDLGRGTAEDQARTMVADLDRIFPGSRAAHDGMKAVRFQWPTFPWTLGSYAGYLPGQWTSIRGAEGEPVGRLFFAGEHCSLASQGFMNGGCETGEAAAREILASLRVAVATPVRRLIAV